ncbi:GNAT family N-acetyltransferase [Micromonospora sp. NPDC005254]|uniref:GNAT family N-acetyltransferase n=1 Tax=Micromonospora sp. NPDC005254 TaxID=3364229 RepID=UPI0036A73539
MPSTADRTATGRSPQPIRVAVPCIPPRCAGPAPTNNPFPGLDDHVVAGPLWEIGRVAAPSRVSRWRRLRGSAAPGPTRAWIQNIEVHPTHRGRGHARRMIQLIEAELAGLGVPELGLNVFGTNTVAIGLYRSLGFEVTAQQMAKRIDPAG